jgi:hypothetical protein
MELANFLLPILVAAGSAFIVFQIMKARVQADEQQLRDALAAARAKIAQFDRELELTSRIVEESLRRQMLQEFVQELCRQDQIRAPRLAANDDVARCVGALLSHRHFSPALPPPNQPRPSSESGFRFDENPQRPEHGDYR